MARTDNSGLPPSQQIKVNDALWSEETPDVAILFSARGTPIGVADHLPDCFAIVTRSGIRFGQIDCIELVLWNSPMRHRVLDDVTHFFLDAKILAEDRSAAALTRWLDQADFVLGRAVKQREYVEGLERKYGSDARVIGG